MSAFGNCRASWTACAAFVSFTSMRSKIYILFIICLAFGDAFSQAKTQSSGSPNALPAAANPYSDADRNFTFGEKADRDLLSLATIERALTADSGNYQWLWRAARCYYYVGDNAGANDKLKYFEKGIDVGQRAIGLQPNAVEGHFWLAANFGGYSEEKGAFKALQMVKKIRAEMEIVLRLNDRYHNGGAYLALGEMDRQLPRIIGGNLSRAISRLEQGIGVAPNNLEMKLALGQAYQEAGRKSEARHQYQEIIGRQVNPAFARAERDIQDKARRFLGRL